MFGKDNVKLKGHRCGLAGKLYKTLKKREAEGHLIVVTIDECKTSKFCSSCFFLEDMKVIDTDSFRGVGAFNCKKCNKAWQRDVNVANNMMAISKSIWSGEQRPNMFCRNNYQSP